VVLLIEISDVLGLKKKCSVTAFGYPHFFIPKRISIHISGNMYSFIGIAYVNIVLWWLSVKRNPVDWIASSTLQWIRYVGCHYQVRHLL